MSNCIKCGASLPEGALFCPKCGASVSGKSTAVSKGDIINFGTYEHGDNVEPIEWIVLNVEDSKALILSKYAIEQKRYNESSMGGKTWNNCDLRTYLNEEFMTVAFSGDEKDRICKTYLPTEEYMESGSAERYPAQPTFDKVFCLSFDEACAYFPEKFSARCKATLHAIEKSTDPDLWVRSGNYCDWWLRNPGWSDGSAAYVWADGSIDNRGHYQFNEGGVRPAMWIKL